MYQSINVRSIIYLIKNELKSHLKVYFFLKKIIYLFTFGCAVSSLQHRLFSNCGKREQFSNCSAWVSHCSGFSCCGWSTGSWAQGLQQLRLLGSRTQAQELWHMGFSCSTACRLFRDQGLNLCLLNWQAYPLPLSHQGRQKYAFFTYLASMFYSFPKVSKSCYSPNAFLSSDYGQGPCQSLVITRRIRKNCHQLGAHIGMCRQVMAKKIQTHQVPKWFITFFNHQCSEVRAT